MPRAGHKEGCKCNVCKAVDAANAQRAVATAPVKEKGDLLSSLPAGAKFRYRGKIWRLLNLVGNAAIVNDLSSDNDAGIEIPATARVERVGP